jgi:Tol biopolymer transport system component
MGEVYRALDTNLKRAVAIKVLPDALAADGERLARLQREAEVLASLNHPHIAQIYGLEKSEGSTALVLELVEGPTLADRIVEGPISIEDALPIAKQIAEALEAAHEQGIVHRDLKPANIKLRPDGQVKVLDFGLAKLATGELASTGPTGLTASPTLTIHATYLGVILGTAAYMSPEQAKGKAVDRRADIWAFGVVLCEMLTGRRMYDGETAAETLARIIEREPDLSALPSATPAAVRTVLERCLTKDPRARLQAIGEARILFDRAIAQPRADERVELGISDTRRRRSGAVAWTLVAMLAVALAALLVLWAPWRTAARTALVKVNADIGVDASLMTDVGTAAVLSPDGQTLAFAARRSDGEPSHLYVRRLDQLSATLLAGTEDARSPFFAPDGQWIAFFAEGKLKKVPVVGGAVVTISDARAGRGGSWAEDGTITFQPDIGAGNASLARVSSAGGKPTFLKPETNGRARFPQVLPGGRAVLYTRYAPATNAQVQIELPDGERRVLVAGSYGRYLPSGHLVYVHESILYAVAFDLERLQPVGETVPIVEGVMTADAASGAQFAVSENGTLVYLAGGGGTTLDAPALSLLDATGKVTELLPSGRNWFNPRFSPDGTRLALDILDASLDVWTYDVKRRSLDRLAFDARALESDPVWTPDGRRIVFRKGESVGAASNLYWVRADLTGKVQRLTDSPWSQIAGSWHPSGKFLAFQQASRQTNPDIWILPMEGDETSGWKPGTPTVLVNTEANEFNPQFSPDGTFLAYNSNETGTGEVWVRPFSGAGGPWQISSGGGAGAVWSRTRQEIFYTTPTQQIMVASYRVQGGAFQRDPPRLWSKHRYLLRGGRISFDLHPDGNRFALAVAPEAIESVKRDELVFVFNLFDELRRLAP